jgi:hypothetical protein
MIIFSIADWLPYITEGPGGLSDNTTGEDHGEPQLHDQSQRKQKEGPPEPQERGWSASGPPHKTTSDKASSEQKGY